MSGAISIGNSKFSIVSNSKSSELVVNSKEQEEFLRAPCYVEGTEYEFKVFYKIDLKNNLVKFDANKASW